MRILALGWNYFVCVVSLAHFDIYTKKFYFVRLCQTLLAFQSGPKRAGLLNEENKNENKSVALRPGTISFRKRARRLAWINTLP